MAAASMKSRKVLFGDIDATTPCDEEMLRLAGGDLISEKIMALEDQEIFKTNVDDFLKQVKEMDDEGWMFPTTPVPFNSHRYGL